MSPATIPPDATRRLAQLLWDRVGLRPARESETSLRLALQARLEAGGAEDPLDYVKRLEDGDEDELRALLPLVTVGKTEFFRDANQFRALRARVVPDMLARARREMRPLRIWSAGCATGEEPYSLAMLACELGVEPEGIDLLATDVNPVAIERAREGLFSARRLVGLAPEFLTRHFRQVGEEWQAKDGLRSYIRFQPHNLVMVNYPLPREGGFWDVILCRNVLIYFDGATTARVVRRFHDHLVDGGYLCLGYSESLYRISNDFDLTEIEGSFVYRKPGVATVAVPPSLPRIEEVVSKLRQAVATRQVRVSPQKAEPGPPETVRAVVPEPLRVPDPKSVVPKEPVLSKPEPAPVPAKPDPAGPKPPEEPAEALPASSSQDPVAQAARLRDGGAFEQALRHLRAAVGQAPGNLALQITLGNVLMVMGHHDEARSSYRAALAAEPLCTEAHLFLGIACFEGGEGYEEEAVRELSRAVFLDPDLGLAHYYTGRLYERRGDVVAARRAYRNAVAACQIQRVGTLGHFPDLPTDPSVLARAARYALAAIEERPPT